MTNSSFRSPISASARPSSEPGSCSLAGVVVLDPNNPCRLHPPEATGERSGCSSCDLPQAKGGIRVARRLGLAAELAPGLMGVCPAGWTCWVAAQSERWLAVWVNYSAKCFSLERPQSVECSEIQPRSCLPSRSFRIDC